MNQTRTFLLIAWLAVAFLLFQQWQSPAAPAPAPATTAVDAQALPQTGGSSLPALPDTAAAPVNAAMPAGVGLSSQTVEIVTDIYRLTVDLKGASIVRAELLTYPLEKKAGSANVLLLDTAPADFFVAQSGWLTKSGQNAPTHEALFQTADGKSAYALADGQDSIAVPFVWTDAASGVRLTKTLVLTRGSFTVRQVQELQNDGAAPWSGFAYEQLKRIAPPPPSKTAGLTNPDSFSFVGSAWYSPADKFEKIKFTDYTDGDGVLQSPTKPLQMAGSGCCSIIS